MTLDLVSVTEIAERAGTTPGTVHSWRRRHPDFPAPLATLAVGPIWDWADVERWLALPRRSGRPRKEAQPLAGVTMQIAPDRPGARDDELEWVEFSGTGPTTDAALAVVNEQLRHHIQSGVTYRYRESEYVQSRRFRPARLTKETSP